MYYYRIYGLNIQSEYEFKEAVSIEKPACQPIDITIEEGEISVELTTETEVDTKEGVLYVYKYEKQNGWIRVRGQGCFVIEQGRKITYKLKENNNLLVISQAFLCLVIPMAMMQQDKLALHGSGILLGNKAVVISGNSGAGKSTLAAGLLNRTGIFMADDIVAIKLKEGKVYAQPAYPQQKICVDSLKHQDKERGSLVLLPPDGGKDKYALRLYGDYCMEEKELSSIFILQVGNVDSVQLQEITGSEKIKYLTNNLYKRKIYLEAGMMPEIFKECIQVANQVKIYSLMRPSRGMTTEIQIEKIMDVLQTY